MRTGGPSRDRGLEIRAGSRVTLELSLPHPTAASLEVFDLQGRHVATPFLGTAHRAGTDRVTLDSRA